MSRYYKIEIGDKGQSVFTNMVNGKADLNALQVEYNITQTLAHETAASQITIWGTGLQSIAQAANFNGLPIRVSGGMQNGLPLATADVLDGQQGLLIAGTIFQAFGNWLGLNQNVTFYILAGSISDSTQSDPANIVFYWPAGMKLSDAIRNALANAFPRAALDINISDITSGESPTAMYNTVKLFADAIRQISMSIKNSDGTGSYQGVSIVEADNTIRVFDGEGTAKQSGKPKAIRIQDMVGQATWAGPATIQFSTVMRADLNVGDIITLPGEIKLQIENTVDSQTQFRAKYQSTFDGPFRIYQIQHIGNSREPAAQAWMSSIFAWSESQLQANQVNATTQ